MRGKGVCAISALLHPPSESDQAASSGEQLGKYELLRHIATGGMAEIHLARAKGIQGFEKIVVVKRILPQLGTNQEFVQMFLDEARIAATLHHPNVVQVYDIGSVGGNYFFSMEFLHGEDVRRIQKRLGGVNRLFPLEHVLTIMTGVCAGLHYAHEKISFDGKPLSIVHRDVSPQNVFVTYDGSVKVVDFGIAKAENRLNETRSGALRGKISYMSPEQCRSLPLDRRSDVFSIAIMLYEMTTGRKLYSGESEFDILKRIVEEDPPPPSSIVPGYPPVLEKIVMKGLLRRREDRYQTAQEMQLELEEFARENRLGLSAISLGRFMGELFADKIQQWRSAEQQGKALPDLLAKGAGKGEAAEIVTRTRTRGSVPAFDSDEGEKTIPSMPVHVSTYALAVEAAKRAGRVPKLIALGALVISTIVAIIYWTRSERAVAPKPSAAVAPASPSTAPTSPKPLAAPSPAIDLPPRTKVEPSRAATRSKRPPGKTSKAKRESRPAEATRPAGAPPQVAPALPDYDNPLPPARPQRP